MTGLNPSGIATLLQVIAKPMLRHIIAAGFCKPEEANPEWTWSLINNSTVRMPRPRRSVSLDVSPDINLDVGLVANPGAVASVF